MNDLDYLKELEFLRIENRGQYLIKQPHHHPASKQYKEFKIKEIKKCIYGLWGKESGGYRWMPPQAYFYANYVWIKQDNEKKEQVVLKPAFDDLEWMLFYMYAECYGFSGFELDEEFSCDSALIDKYEMSVAKNNKKRWAQIHKPDGSLKEYEKAQDYLYRLHTKNLGKPLWNNDAKDAIILGSRGAGKQLQLSEKIRIKNGWTTMGDVQIGDEIYGSDGKLTKVTAKSSTEEREYYKITLRDGREIEACEDHLWKIWDKNKNKKVDKEVYSVINTKEMFKKYYWNRIDSKHKQKFGEEKMCKEYRFAIPTMKAIDEVSNNLPIDPYLLGLLLGDGCIVNSPSITSGDKEIIKFVQEECDRNNWTYRVEIEEGKDCIYITNKNKVNKSLKDLLKKLNLFGTKSNTKFIPEQYLYTSEENKRALLQGLMDTDGTCGGDIEYYTVSKQLSEDFSNLVRSIGINCKIALKKTYYKKDGVKILCKDCYRIMLYTDTKVFRLDRKQEEINMSRRKSRYNKTFITNIEPIGLRKGACISVDNEDRTYITKDYIVTHNSYGLIGLTLWFMCLDGAKSFSKEFSEMRISANVIMGSADETSKKNFLIGLEDGMNYLLTEEDLGVYKYKTKGLEDIPLVGRHMLGKTNNFWRYRFIENGLESGGSGSSFSPIAYSPNKKGGGATAAASRRVHLSIVDEVGKLQVSAIAVWGSNRALTRRTTKFGSQVFAGTSGNMDLIQEAKKMFQNPKDFEMVSFENKYEKNSNEIGFFIPAFLAKRQFKDEDGNTNIVDAVDFYLRERENSKTSEKLNEEKMNYPLIPEDMWITKESSILPREEAKAVKRRLLTNDLYKKKRTFIRMNWDSTKASGVDYKIINEENAIKLDTFRETQGTNEKKNRGSKSTECDIIIYEFPEANAPNDLYKFGGLDPYVAEELEDGESLGSFYLLKNPKYISEGISGDIIVAEIIGKYSGRAEYNERVEKLMALYGNPSRSIMFESDRGDDLKEYFMKKNKEHLLALSPVKYEDNKVVMKTRLSYGFSHGNQIGKLHNLTQLKEWLLEETTINGETLRNIERITSIGLLDEIIEYDWDLDKAKKANYDRISAFLGCIIARRENYNQLTKNEKPENTKGILADFAKKGIISKLQNKLKWQNSYTTGKYQT